MPRIPQIVTPKESYISNFRLTTPRVTDIGVAKARPTQISGTGEGILAGVLDDVSGALEDVADLFAVKEETVRAAKSQHLQLDINNTFRDLKIKSAERTSDQVVGMLDEFKESEEDFRILNIPDNLDAKTTQELTQQFNKEYNKHAAWIVNHTIQQSNIADKEARIRVIQNAHQNIADLTVGDSAGIEQEIIEALSFEIARHPDLTENQIETNQRALREDFVTFALTKWSIDNPTATVNFWNANQEYLKKALPAMYPALLKKIEIAKEDSTYNIAFATVRRLTKGDNAYAAKLIEEDDSDQFGLTAKQRLHLSSALRGIHTYEIAEEERVHKQKEENYLRNSHEKFYNPETRTTDIAGAIIDLDEEYKRGTVSPTTYRTQRNQLLAGIPFSAERSQQLLRDIDDLKVTTTGEVLAAVQGTGTHPGVYEAARKQRQAEVVKGFTSNYFNEAEEKYKELAKITQVKELPSGIEKKELLVSLVELPAFRRRLEDDARKLGYTAGDPRILDLADKLMENRWYGGFSLHTIQDVPEGISYPGEAPWYIIGETPSRAWKIPDFIPDVKEIATGGSVVSKEEDTIFEDLMKTSKGQEAYTQLGKAEIPVDLISLQQMIELIASEKEEK